MSLRTSQRLAAFALVCLCTSLTGCGSAVIFSTSYLAGIELEPGENGEQNASVGLQKYEGVFMPGCGRAGRWPFERCQEVLPKAYATLAVSDLDTGTLLLGGLTDVKITQVIATGTAAKLALSSGAAVNAFNAMAGEYCADSNLECIENWIDGDDEEGSRALALQSWWQAQGHGGFGILRISTCEFTELRSAFIAAQAIPCQSQASDPALTGDRGVL